MKPVLSTLAVALAILVITAATVEAAHAGDIYPVGFHKYGCPKGCPDICGPTPPPVYPYGGGPWNGCCVPVMPCCPPFNGLLPATNNQGLNGGCPLPQHPYARSPRDYFMYYDRY